MKKKDNLIIIFLFASFILSVGIGGLVTADKSFSDNENRVLQTMPEVSCGSLLSGDFEEAFARYMDDQIPFRDQWMAARSGLRLAALQREINGVYMGTDGYLIEKTAPEEASRALYRKNLKAVETFCNSLGKEVKTSVMLVPTTAEIMKDKLPGGAARFDEVSFAKEAEERLKSCGYVDLYPLFRKKAGELQLYYKTDHHWTTEGAREAFLAWMPEGKKAIENLEEKVLAEDFLGTLYSKVLWNRENTDRIKGYMNREQTDFRVRADGKELDGIYQDDFLKKKDKYSFFFGGNYGCLKAEKVKKGETVNNAEKGQRTASSGTHLLIIKDSFANCFAPFALEAYDEVSMVDLRYFSGNLRGYIEEEQVTEVLVLYSMKNFIEDKNIAALGAEGMILA